MSTLKAGTYNNIHITNSSVGVINTGNLARIDAAITISKGTDGEEFGARLKDLTDSILSNSELNDIRKQELIEVLQTISDQAIGNRRPSMTVVSALFGKLKELSVGVTVISAGVEKLHEAWTSLASLF
jgi:hypothetical protein